MAKNRHEIEIEIKGKEWEEALDQAFKKKNSEVTIKGFRKGKAPKNIYLKEYKIESLFNEAVSSLADKAYEKAFEKLNREDIVTKPTLDIKEVDENHVIYNFIFITKPEVEIKKYKGFNIKYEEPKVEKGEVDQEIKTILESFGEVKPKDGAIKNGDIAVIDFEGFKDSVPFEGGKGENHHLEIGSNTFIPGFEDELINMKKNDSKTFKITFPEDYFSEDLKGKEVEFKVDVKEVKEKVGRKMDQEFFEQFGNKDIKDEKSFREEIKKRLLHEKEHLVEEKYMNELFEKILEKTEIELPEELIQEESHMLAHEFEQKLMMQGINLELYFNLTGEKPEEFEEKLNKDATRNLKVSFILDKIKELEKIKATDKDKEDFLKELKEMHNLSEDEIKKEKESPYLKHVLENKMTIEKLKELNMRK